MDVIDFMVDGRSYLGQPVTIMGCSFGNAFVGGVDCLAFRPRSPDLPIGPAWGGTIIVDGATLDRESLRRALRYCADFGPKPECFGNVNGTVYDPFAEAGIAGNPVIGVKNATIDWTTPK